jgi:hypothetical protein
MRIGRLSFEVIYVLLLKFYFYCIVSLKDNQTLNTNLFNYRFLHSHYLISEYFGIIKAIMAVLVN